MKSNSSAMIQNGVAVPGVHSRWISRKFQLGRQFAQFAHPPGRLQVVAEPSVSASDANTVDPEPAVVEDDVAAAVIFFQPAVSLERVRRSFAPVQRAYPGIFE